jgi:hypothetical protein
VVSSKPTPQLRCQPRMRVRMYRSFSLSATVFSTTVLSQELAEEVGSLTNRHAREGGHPEAFDFPGFRVAPPLPRGLPGMTIGLSNNF